MTPQEQAAHACAANMAAAVARNQDLIDDVEWILTSTDSIEDVTRRLGYKPATLAQRLHRHGRDDLARPFWALARRQRLMSVSATQRIQGKYEIDESGCHLWLRAVNSRGYGVVRFAGKVRLAHRVAWFARHDSWPDQSIVFDHTCNRKDCVNADHLRELTDSSNIRRAYAVGGE